MFLLDNRVTKPHLTMLLKYMITQPVPRQCILLFTRYPEPGKSKTRLIPALGPTGAASLQQKMTERAVKQAIGYSHPRDCQLDIYFTGGSTARMQQWLGDQLTLHRQAHGDLGEKMHSAFAAHHRQSQQCILIGSDCPAITTTLLTEAFCLLQDHDMVIGPATDGGYYLIGLNNRRTQPHPDLFSHMAWGTSDVYDMTIARANHLNLHWAALPKLHDIDTPHDLGYLHCYPDLQ